MYRLTIIFLFGLVAPKDTLAQIAGRKSISFSSTNSIGLINGSRNEAVALQTINGIRKDKWFAGLGVGIDYYFYRSAPLFIDIQRELLSKKNTPFVYVDYGINLPLLKDDQKNSRGPTEYSNGNYYDFGFGWKLKGSKPRAIIFSAGYSYKQIKEEVTLMWWAPGPISEMPKEKYDNRLTRLVVKVGIAL